MRAYFTDWSNADAFERACRRTFSGRYAFMTRCHWADGWTVMW